MVFNQEESKAVQAFNAELDGKRRRAGIPRGHWALLEWDTKRLETIESVSERLNRLVLRHEGAHQLCMAYGIHSGHDAEHLWLIEGLASWFENPSEEGASDGYAAVRGVWEGGHAVRFPELVNTPALGGFATLGDEKVVAAGYAQSWFLVHYLMENHRDAFFDYVRFVRDPANEAELADAGRFALLARFAGYELSDVFEDDLESALREAIGR